MALSPTANIIARFRIEGTPASPQFVPVPILDCASKGGGQTVTIVSADPSVNPNSNCTVQPPADPISYCFGLLKALSIPSPLNGPYCVTIGSLTGAAPNSVVPTAISGGVGGQA